MLDMVARYKPEQQQETFDIMNLLEVRFAMPIARVRAVSGLPMRCRRGQGSALAGVTALPVLQSAPSAGAVEALKLGRRARGR